MVNKQYISVDNTDLKVDWLHSKSHLDVNVPPNEKSTDHISIIENISIQLKID